MQSIIAHRCSTYRGRSERVTDSNYELGLCRGHLTQDREVVETTAIFHAPSVTARSPPRDIVFLHRAGMQHSFSSLDNENGSLCCAVCTPFSATQSVRPGSHYSDQHPQHSARSTYKEMHQECSIMLTQSRTCQSCHASASEWAKQTPTTEHWSVLRLSQTGQGTCQRASGLWGFNTWI